jgi:ADP-ribose pyrophosphatase YjhB (NUDIX family)
MGLRKKAPPTRRPSTQRSWKRLRAEDIDAILEDAELDASRALREELRLHINRQISIFGALRDGRRKAAPGVKIAEYRKIASAAKRLTAALNACDDAQTALAYEWDRLAESPSSKIPASMDQLRAKWPDSSEEAILAAYKFRAVVQSPEAKHAVREAWLTVALFEVLAKNAAENERRQQEHLNTRSSPRRTDDARLGLVSVVAAIFQHFLKKRSTTSQEGCWVKFLAAFLSRIEDKALSIEGAKSLWLDARRWRTP